MSRRCPHNNRETCSVFIVWFKILKLINPFLHQLYLIIVRCSYFVVIIFDLMYTEPTFPMCVSIINHAKRSSRINIFINAKKYTLLMYLIIQTKHDLIDIIPIFFASINYSLNHLMTFPRKTHSFMYEFEYHDKKILVLISTNLYIIRPRSISIFFP